MHLNINPLILIEGPKGCGKSRLTKIAAKILGINLVESDFANIQSLTSAQTEAKLRIVFNSAEKSVPCILLMHNIQVNCVK